MTYAAYSLASRIYSPPFASNSTSPNSKPHRINSSPSSMRRRNQPSIAEIQRAIGVVDEDPMSVNTPSSSSASNSSSNSFLDLLASTPIGQPEGEAERKLREAAEWMVDRTEANSLAERLGEAGARMTALMRTYLITKKKASFQRAKNSVGDVCTNPTSLALAPPHCIWRHKAAI